jgi:hypothetical protein
MKRFFPFFAAIFLIASGFAMGTAAQDANGLDFGFSVGDRHGDFSLGLEAGSPRFLGDFLKARIGAEILWKEGISGGETLWRSYYLARLGLAGYAASNDFARLYGEFGGVAAQLPSSASFDPRFGIYGLFGFEFAFAKGSPGCYFIELGSTGAFGFTDPGFDNSPIVANGFSARAGFRWRI